MAKRLNPLALDPTRTTMIRRQFMAAMSRRFSELKSEIIKLVALEDAFGLKSPQMFSLNTVYTGLLLRPYDEGLYATNQRWRFRTNADKVSAFREWLQGQVDEKILTVDGTGDPWLSVYVHSGYRQGVVRAWTDARPDLEDQPAGFAAGSKAQFIRDAFSQPEAVSKLKLLSTRSLEELKGVTTQMAADMNRVLGDAIAQGKGPRQVARELAKRVDISKKRALLIARTEIIHAHSEGQLDSFERLGIDELGVMVEWSTAGDNRVCPSCQSLAGVVLTVKQARGLIPRHPGCRCAFIPAFKDRRETGQKRGPVAVRRAFDLSIKRERPKLTTKQARKKTAWLGASKRFPKRKRRV